MEVQAVGLVVFVTIQFLNVFGLCFDLFLYLMGHLTITEHVWKDPILAFPILFVQAMSFTALSIHFYWR